MNTTCFVCEKPVPLAECVIVFSNKPICRACVDASRERRSAELRQVLKDIAAPAPFDSRHFNARDTPRHP